VLGLVIIRHLRDNPEEEAAMDILPAPEVSVSARPFRPVSHSPDQLDNSRFQDN